MLPLRLLRRRECTSSPPPPQVSVKELFAGTKGVLFGVPGAFTPGCSKTHLPGYVSDHDKLKVHGVGGQVQGAQFLPR